MTTATDKAESTKGFAEFWQAYCDALCWTSRTEDGEALFPCEGEFTDHYNGQQEINRLLDSKDVEQLKETAANFFNDNRHLFAEQWKQAGQDFHLSRNGHGAGFFDRDCYNGEENELQQLAKQHGTLELLGTLTEDGEQENVFVCN